MAGLKVATVEAAKAKNNRAEKKYAAILPDIKRRREPGETMETIAAWLNSIGLTTSTGKPFSGYVLWQIVRKYLGPEYSANRKHPRRCGGAVAQVPEAPEPQLPPLTEATDRTSCPNCKTGKMYPVRRYPRPAIPQLLHAPWPLNSS